MPLAVQPSGARVHPAGPASCIWRCAATADRAHPGLLADAALPGEEGRRGAGAAAPRAGGRGAGRVRRCSGPAQPPRSTIEPPLLAQARSLIRDRTGDHAERARSGRTAAAAPTTSRISSTAMPADAGRAHRAPAPRPCRAAAGRRAALAVRNGLGLRLRVLGLFHPHLPRPPRADAGGLAPRRGRADPPARPGRRACAPLRAAREAPRHWARLPGDRPTTAAPILPPDAAPAAAFFLFLFLRHETDAGTDRPIPPSPRAVRRREQRRRQVMGDAFVDRALGAADAFSKPLQTYVNRARLGLDLAALRAGAQTAQPVHRGDAGRAGPQPGAQGHLRGAMNNGATLAEIREVLLHVALPPAPRPRSRPSAPRRNGWPTAGCRWMGWIRADGDPPWRTRAAQSMDDKGAEMNLSDISTHWVALHGRSAWARRSPMTRTTNGCWRSWTSFSTPWPPIRRIRWAAGGDPGRPHPRIRRPRPSVA